MSIGEVNAGVASTPIVQSKTKSVISETDISGSSTVGLENKSMTQHADESQEALASHTVLSAMQRMYTDPTYKPTLQEEKAIENIKKINEELVGANRELQISIHDDTKRIIAKVVDTDTKEVIKEIPSEKLLDMFYCMMEYSGLLVDEKR